MDQIVVAHRGRSDGQVYGEGTLASYKYAVANHADILDGDIHWTKDSPNDSDKLGSILVIHDPTLNRITNCAGKVSSWLWTTIRDKCRTDIGKQRLIRLKTLIAYGNSVGKKDHHRAQALDDHQRASQAVMEHDQVLQCPAGSAVRLWCTEQGKEAGQRPTAGTRSTMRWWSSGSGGWPSVSKVKSVGTYFHAELSIPASRMRTYKNAGIRVFLWTGKTKSDYTRMAKLNPYGVVVNDVAKFQAWRDTQT